MSGSRFSETVLDHAQSPSNCRAMPDADRFGMAGAPGGGRYLVVYLKLNGQQVTEASFQCGGCGVTVAAGSMLTELVIGRSIEACRRLTPEELTEALGGLPADKRSCAVVAISALADAIGTDENAGEGDEGDG